MKRSLAFLARLKRWCAEALLSLALLAGISLAVITAVAVVLEKDSADLVRGLLEPLLSYGGWMLLVGSAAPLWLTAEAFSLPYAGGYYNIGIEGQVLIGGFTTAACALSLAGWLGEEHRTLIVTGAVLCGAFCGGAWSLLAFMVRKYFGVSEVIATVLLNFCAAILVNLLTKMPVVYDASAQGVQTKRLPTYLVLSRWGNGTMEANATLMILVFGVLIIATQSFLWLSGAGLTLRAVGRNERAAAFCGVETEKVLATAVVLGGMLGGVAGTNEILGSGVFRADFLSGWGFEGIVVAILGRFRLAGVVVVASFFALWRLASAQFQILQIPFEVFLMAEAIFLLVFLSKGRSRLW